MGFEAKGFDELIKALSELDNRAKNKIAKEAVDKASDVMLNRLKKEAPRAKENSRFSYAFLDKKMLTKNGGAQAKMGINSSNWSMTKGLWYHYWGFRSHPRDNWMDRAFNSSVDECNAIISEKIKEGLEW